QGAAGKMDRRRRARRAAGRAGETRQPAAEDAAHRALPAQRVGLGPLRSRAQAPRRPGASPRPLGPLADVVRQSHRAAGKRPAPLATDLDAARPQRLRHRCTAPVRAFTFALANAIDTHSAAEPQEDGGRPDGSAMSVQRVSTIFFDLGDTLVRPRVRAWVPGAKATLEALRVK